MQQCVYCYSDVHQKTQFSTGATSTTAVSLQSLSSTQQYNYPTPSKFKNYAVHIFSFVILAGIDSAVYQLTFSQIPLDPSSKGIIYA